MDTMIASREHPAVRAWHALAPDAAPANVVVLRERDKSSVFRLDGAGPHGESVVAKQCRTPAGRVERAVYEEILPRLPVSAPRCHGHVVDDDDSCWLFLQLVEGVRFAPTVLEHRLLAARWLGRMHASAAAVPAAAELPDRGPAHHLAQLRGARVDIFVALAARAPARAERELLADVVALCERVEARWSDVDAWCADMPRTLVHGDFRPKNVFIATGESGPQVLAVDWETAGWGVPATDVASLRSAPGEESVLTEYARLARTRWPWMSLAMVARMIEGGRLFRRVAAIAWCSASLAQRWERSILGMEVHRAELGALLEARRW